MGSARIDKANPQAADSLEPETKGCENLKEIARGEGEGGSWQLPVRETRETAQHTSQGLLGGDPGPKGDQHPPGKEHGEHMFGGREWGGGHNEG